VLLARIRREAGPDAKINGAEKIRVGGVLGFFAKEHYRVVVEAPGTAPGPVSPGAVTPDPVTPDSVTSDPVAPEAADDRPSRRARRKNAASSPAPVEGPAPVSAGATVPTDVFSAMAEATDDVNDIGARPAAAPLADAAPIPAAIEATEVAEVPESFDAVLSRVASTLETDPDDDAAVTGDGTADGNGAIAPPLPAPDETVVHVPAGIASKAALFLAETVPGGPGGPPDAVAGALRRTGLDGRLVASVAEGLRQGAGLEALLLEAFASLVPAPPVPRRAGSLLVVVGAGVPARRLAAAVAADIGTDPAEVPFASRDDAAHAVVTGRLLVRSAEDAAELAPGWRRSRAAVVVIDAPVTGPERSWATHLIAALRPTAVWGVVDATAKAEDVAAWAEALGGIDALALENLEATVSPASALGVGIPVARIDGQPATAARWVAAIVDRMAPCT